MGNCCRKWCRDVPFICLMGASFACFMEKTGLLPITQDPKAVHKGVLLISVRLKLRTRVNDLCKCQEKKINKSAIGFIVFKRKRAKMQPIWTMAVLQNCRTVSVEVSNDGERSQLSLDVSIVWLGRHLLTLETGIDKKNYFLPSKNSEGSGPFSAPPRESHRTVEINWGRGLGLNISDI